MASRARSIRRLTSSTARLISFPFLRLKTADRRLGRGSFVPGLLATADEDASFVPFAGQQDGIPGAGAADRMRDPLPPVLDAGILLALSPADLFRTRRNVAEDGHGVLFAWVFVGKNGVVAQAGRDLAHPGPLLAVAVTGATEDRDQLPTRDGPQLAQDLLERKSDGNTGRDRRQRVGGVPTAAQLQPQSQGPERCRSLHPQAFRGRLDPLSLEIRIQLKPIRD